MGRPLNKRLFGDNSKNNIKVQFFNGLNSVRGYIVKQLGNNKFKCKDENGVTAICRLVEKNSVDLQAGEMTITVKYDDTSIRHVKKIAAHLITVSTTTNTLTGQTSPTGYAQSGWTFVVSNSDHKWQIEEAGTNTNMASAIDLEGDDDPNADYPVPGSGSFQAAVDAFSGMSYALIGSTATVSGGTLTVSNSASGLMRAKYPGHYSAMGGSTSTWNTAFFSTATLTRRIADTHVSWGAQVDTVSQQNFSMEWKGYIQVPTTQNYNFYAEVDDDCAVWIGQTALAANPATTTMYGSNKSMPGSTIKVANTLNMTAGTWYPIRIWMTEFTGSSKFQIYAIGANGTKYNGENLQWCYNTSTLGY
jgi:hypothetical protein